MDREITEYYKKAQKILNETDGAILTYQERKNGKVTTNTLVNKPKKAMDIVEMFRSNYIACKMMLESLDDKDVKKYGADDILRASILMGEPENLRKVFITK